METESFDVVLIVGPNEIDIIDDVVSHVKLNVEGYNKIYLISPIELNIENCISILDSSFPFSIKDIENIIGYTPRINWIYQQLLKLYCINIIPKCSYNILVIDSDVFMLKKLKFFENDKPIFTVSYEQTIEYHKHSQRLHPSLIRVFHNYSGISHHMVFNRFYLSELFQLIEKAHNDSFFNVFLNSLDISKINENCCSEYEIYFNFMAIYHPDKYILRELNWRNVKYYPEGIKNGCHFISVPKNWGGR